MTRFDGFPRELESWLEAEANLAVPAGLHGRVLEVTTGRQPQPSLVARIGSHWVDGMPAVGPLATRWARPVLMAVMTLLVLGAAILLAGQMRQPPRPDVPLVYSREGAIFLADGDGRDAVAIAGGSPSGDGEAAWYALLSWPADGNVWAPDGSAFVYYEVRPGQAPGVITHISDASGRRLGSFVIDDQVPGPTRVGDHTLKSTWLTWWSPDSTLLAALPWTADSIRIFGVDGRLRDYLRLPVGYSMWREGGLRWAPDGRSVLVVITNQGGATEREVWQVPLDGSLPRHLRSDHPLAAWDVTASRDGSRIAFSGHNSPFQDGGIFVANADGTDARAVAHMAEGLTGTATYPMWSPDQTQLAYRVGREVWVVDLRTGVDRLVLVANDDDMITHRWSADGGRLLVLARRVNPIIDGKVGPPLEADGTALWSVRTDGTDPHLVVEDVDAFGASPPLLAR